MGDNVTAEGKLGRLAVARAHDNQQRELLSNDVQPYLSLVKFVYSPLLQFTQLYGRSE